MKYVFILLIVLCSCQDTSKYDMILLMKEWRGKEIIFPTDLKFTIQGMNEVKHLGEKLDYSSFGCKEDTCKYSLNPNLSY